MTREILFRAKRIDNCKWTQGYLFRMWESAYILWGMNNNSPDMTKVDSDTICEYTGLTDQNGTKIFENDILSVGEKIFYVKYDNSGAQYVIDNDNDGIQRELGYYWGNEIEVIGNIFDNQTAEDGQNDTNG